VHHFTTVGACAIVGGGSRVTFDIPPYMMAFGSECASVRSVNLIGMQRAGISSLAIEQVKLAHRLHIRQFKSVAQMREAFNEKYGETLTPEVVSVFEFLERQRLGKSGRQREVFRNAPAPLKAAA
jgi:UDP-N-acetylglucosamine acyltransferase